jgi:hypothetical protein
MFVLEKVQQTPSTKCDCCKHFRKAEPNLMTGYGSLDVRINEQMGENKPLLLKLLQIIKWM